MSLLNILNQVMDDLLKITRYYDGDFYRNISGIRVSQAVFDDLSDDESDQNAAILADIATKPQANTARISRPFHYGVAISSPFEERRWLKTRFSDGSFGVWYGCVEFETTIHETLYHWKKFLKTSHYDCIQEEIVTERRVFKVRCQSRLYDLSNRYKEFPEIRDSKDYSYTHAVAKRVQTEGKAGLLFRSARCEGTNSAIFKAEVLSAPRDHCYLTYRLKDWKKPVVVERNGMRISLEKKNRKVASVVV